MKLEPRTTLAALCLMSLAHTLVPSSRAQEPQRTGPPSVRYGSPRTSERWLEVGGVRHAVDQGATWRGVTVYLSLTHEMIAVDAKSGAVLWSKPASAFWNELGFAEVAREGATDKVWAVELRPGRDSGAGKDLRERHDLATGALLTPANPPPSGAEIAPLASFGGAASAGDKPLTKVFDTADAFEREVLRGHLSGVAGAPKLAELDFTRFRVLYVGLGNVVNRNAVSAQAWDQGERVLVRLHIRSFQTASFGGTGGGAQRHSPWGVFLVPRMKSADVIRVERDVQGLIGGPSIWEPLDVAVERKP